MKPGPGNTESESRLDTGCYFVLNSVVLVPPSNWLGTEEICNSNALPAMASVMLAIKFLKRKYATVAFKNYNKYHHENRLQTDSFLWEQNNLHSFQTASAKPPHLGVCFCSDKNGYKKSKTKVILSWMGAVTEALAVAQRVSQGSHRATHGLLDHISFLELHQTNL